MLHVTKLVASLQHLEHLDHLWHLMPNDHLLRRTRRVVLMAISVVLVIAMATDVFAGHI